MLNVPDTEIKEGQFNLLLDKFEGPIDLLLILIQQQFDKVYLKGHVF